MRNLITTSTVLMGLFVALQSDALACKIPVFRYALERWSPDPYELIVFHRGPMDEAQQGLVEKLKSAGRDEARPANLYVRTVDIADDATHEATLVPAEVIQSYANIEAPQLVVHYPPRGPARWIAWSGALTEKNVDDLVDSPARQEIMQRLLSGDSAVWVLIECDDPQLNDKAAETLKQELRRMDEALKLPSLQELQAEEEFQAGTNVELRIGFSMVRLNRDDASESIFRSMLLNSEDDLTEFNEPITLPIFGRGRTYFALVGRGINSDTIEDNCRFICGDCSCQVKEQNPGIDMLLAMNWDEHVLGTAMPSVTLPELTGIGGLEIFDLDDLEQGTDSTETVDQAVTEATPSEPTGADPVATAKQNDAQLALVTQDTNHTDQGPTAEQRQSRYELPVSTVSGTRKPIFAWTLGAVGVVAVMVIAASWWFRPRESL